MRQIASPKASRRMGTNTEIRLNAPLLPVVVAVFAVFYALTGFRGWLLFLLGTGGLWLLALSWVLSLQRGLHIDRKVHVAWATVGDSVPEYLEVINTSAFPALWLEIVDESDTLLQPLRLVVDVGRHATRRRYPVHSFKRRGLYTLGPTRARTGDPFGVYTLTIRHADASTVMITPPQLALAHLRISPGGWVGNQKQHSLALAREISDASLRHYAAGDSLKRVHWRASAHHDTLIVRQLQAAAADDWWIFVDLDARAQAGAGQDSTLELSIVLAASLAMRGLREHRRVGLALVGPRLTWLEPRSDAGHPWRILRALSMAEAGDRRLEDLFSAGHPSRAASVIAVTPTVDPAWVAVAASYHRTGAVMGLLVDPRDFGGTFDQGRVIAALARSRIPFARMPGSLLAEAYAALRRSNAARISPLESRRRYLAHTGSAWHSID